MILGGREKQHHTRGGEGRGGRHGGGGRHLPLTVDWGWGGRQNLLECEEYCCASSGGPKRKYVFYDSSEGHAAKRLRNRVRGGTHRL